MSDSCNPMDCSPPRLLCLWIFPGKDTGLGCHFLLQGIFPTQGSNPRLLHCRRILYWLSHQGSPTLKEFPSPSHCFTLCHLLLCSPSFSYACLLCSCPESTKSQQTIVTKSTKFWSQVVGVKILPLLFISNLLTFLCLSFFHLQNENNNSTYLIGLLKGLNVWTYVKYLEYYLSHNKYYKTIG